MRYLFLYFSMDSFLFQSFFFDNNLMIRNAWRFIANCTRVPCRDAMHCVSTVWRLYGGIAFFTAWCFIAHYVQTPCMASLRRDPYLPVTTPSIKLILNSFNFSISCSFNEMAVAILVVAISIYSAISVCSSSFGNGISRFPIL